MNYLSVCSGIEAATVAWHDLGWNPVAFSEIEKFPSEVLEHHYPDVPNLGDMTKYKEWNLDTIGLLVGGTPCQSFSVARLRKGLDDPRGNLALTYVGILDKFRPKWCLWENVPGVLSSGSGRDFGSFLGALVQLGYGFAYRVLDAQYFGVPQRRRRVFVVGCSSGWESAAKVLFESESLSGDIKKGKKSREKTSRNVRTSIGALCARDYKGVGSQYVDEGKCIVEPIGFENSCRDGVRLYGNVTNTLQAFAGTGGGNGPMVSYAIQDASGREKSQNGKGWNENVGYTIDTQGLQGVVHGTQDPCISNIAFAMGRNSGQENILFKNMAVRKLTPVECERLQGFPDNYTNIKENCPDGHRYKALGNSMAVPVMRWIGQRIKMVNAI